MSSTIATNEAVEETKAGGGGRRKLILLAVPLLLAVIGAGLWFSGVLPRLLGLHREAPAAAGAKAAEVVNPVYTDVPEIITNLDTGGRRQSYVKLKARLELAKIGDQAIVAAAMPRILDIFQTYLREMHPDELRGSSGTYRLREEMIARANLAAQPARIVDILFEELLVQ
jgi:flagellar FliL protein